MPVILAESAVALNAGGGWTDCCGIVLNGRILSVGLISPKLDDIALGCAGPRETGNGVGHCGRLLGNPGNPLTVLVETIVERDRWPDVRRLWARLEGVIALSWLRPVLPEILAGMLCGFGCGADEDMT